MVKKNKEKSPSPNLFEYTDYRRYLADYYQSKKNEKPGFSYRLFSRKAELSSPSYLLDVIKGKKNVEGKSLSGFCKALEFNSRERLYFENLVRFNQATNQETKRYYYEQLLPILQKENGTRLATDQYEYFNHWYAPIIREMVGLENFREDPVWISHRLRRKITPTEAKKTLQLLLDLKMIERDAQGRLKPTVVNLTTPAEVSAISVVKFHEEMLERAKESLGKDAGSKREISSITAALTPTQFRQFKQEIQEFQNKMMQYLENTDPSAPHVYQFNCQLFSLTDLQEGETDVAPQQLKVG
ncbi:MAG: TIGR02147 family protein [Deltaproteobacteria bacterium]|nr:TIGR02147 family protein [Deltaproteobacteria bacterium]